MISERSFDQRVQLAASGVSFNLPIPKLGIKLYEPASEQFELIHAEGLHLPFKFFNLTHSALS